MNILFRGGIYDDHIRFGGVVFVLHSRRGGFLPLLQLVEHRRVHFHFSQYRLQLGQGDPAGPEDPGRTLGQSQHRGLHAHSAVTPVQKGVHAAGQVLLHVAEGGGAGFPGQVGRGGCQRHPCGVDHRPGCGMGGAAHCHSGKPPAGFLGHQIRLGQDDGQRAGPEGVSQFLGGLGNLPHQRRQLGKLADVDDQRVIRGPAFGRIDFFHGGAIQSVSSQAVHRFRRDGHQASPAEDLPRCLDVVRAVVAEK